MNELHPLSEKQAEEPFGAVDEAPVLLKNSEVHVWSAPLDLVSGENQYLRLLNEEEKSRALRLRSRLSADRFIASRGHLRIILSRYTGIKPADIVFDSGRNGKPILAAQDCGITFNLSHSAGLALIAVARDMSVGIDIEAIDPALKFLPIADRYFSPGELSTLRSLPEDQQLDAFYVCWTRKEAYMKACGAGFSLRTDGFSVSLAPGAPPEIICNDLDPEEPGRWFFADLPVPAGFRGALAVEGNSVAVQCLTLHY